MTVNQIIAITGTDATQDVKMLSSAANAADTILAGGAGVMIHPDRNDFFNAVDQIAGEAGAFSEEEESALAEIGRAMAGTEFWDPGAIACDLYTPKVCAAYYLGLAVGLRLAAAAAPKAS